MMLEVCDVIRSPATLETPETICPFIVRLSFEDDTPVNVPDARLSAMTDTLLLPASMTSLQNINPKHELFQTGVAKMDVTRPHRRSHGRELTKGLVSSLTVELSSGLSWVIVIGSCHHVGQ